MNKIEISLAEKFSEWVHKLKINDIPEEVVNKLQLIIIDSFGLMVSAKNEPYIKSLINALKEQDIKMKEQQEEIDRLKTQEERLERLERLVAAMD